MKISAKTIVYLLAIVGNAAFFVLISRCAIVDSGMRMAVVPWAAIIGGAGSVIGGVLGSIQAAKQRKELNKQQKELDQWYQGEMGTNILDRADSRAMLKRIRDYYDERQRKQNTKNIKGGASEEAEVAQAVAANKGIADAASRISAIGQQHKDNVAGQYRHMSYNIGQQKAGLAGGGAQTLANSISSASGVLGDLIGDFRSGAGSVNKKAKQVRDGGNFGIPQTVTDSILDSLDKRL